MHDAADPRLDGVRRMGKAWATTSASASPRSRCLPRSCRSSDELSRVVQPVLTDRPEVRRSGIAANPMDAKKLLKVTSSASTTVRTRRAGAKGMGEASQQGGDPEVIEEKAIRFRVHGRQDRRLQGPDNSRFRQEQRRARGWSRAAASIGPKLRRKDRDFKNCSTRRRLSSAGEKTRPRAGNSR